MGRMFRQISTAAGSTTVADSVADKAPSSKHFCKWRSYYYDPPAGVSDLGERRRRLRRESTSGQSPDSCGERAGAPQLTAADYPRHGGRRPMRAESRPLMGRRLKARRDGTVGGLCRSTIYSCIVITWRYLMLPDVNPPLSMQTLPSGPNRGSPCSPPPPAARGSSCREPDCVTRPKAEPPWWTAIRACKRWRRSPGSVRFAAAIDAVSARIERAQENSQAGPCLDALRNRKPVR
jgi:hypothetical protein